MTRRKLREMIEERKRGTRGDITREEGHRQDQIPEGEIIGGKDMTNTQGGQEIGGKEVERTEGERGADPTIHHQAAFIAVVDRVVDTDD